jgi:hypothetical protein
MGMIYASAVFNVLYIPIEQSDGQSPVLYDLIAEDKVVLTCAKCSMSIFEIC